MKSSESSQIFCGHRALGYVSNHVPLISRYVKKRRENLIATSVGKSFHTYGGSKLGLLSVSGIHPEEITTLAADTFMVYSAAGNQIYAWRRGCELKHIYKGHEHPVKLLLPFGPHLISIDVKSQLKVFDIKAEKSFLHLEFDEKSFNISALCHPVTYKDKILLGSHQGILQLWNLNSAKKIYQFRGWNSSVTCLEPCPTVLDAVAIGLKNGEILVHNLKFDETFVKFKQDWGPVTCLTFRSDRNDILISGSSGIADDQGDHSGSGHIAIWNLNERKLSAQMRDAHLSDVTGMACFPGEPLLVTSSPDNTIKQWIFDLPDGGGRLLKLREGHAEPPNKIRFYGSLGRTIISAAEDSTLRSFSTETDLLNKSFGVASYNRKLSKKHKKIENPVKMHPIVDFTTETSKEEEWDNIACVHRDTTVVTSWSFKKQKMGDLKLRHTRFKENPQWRDSLATCLNLSMCGNFVFIGYNSGHVDKFNIQSGLFRGCFGSEDQPAHTGGAIIRGIVSDGLNQIVITGDNKGLLKFWRFSNHNLLKGRVEFDSSIRHMVLHRESSLLAISLDDLTIEIIDIMTRKTVRKFQNVHKSPLTDMTYSNDSRWLLTSSLDKTIKVWDVPSGSLVDHIGFSESVTSLTMSPTSEFLATTHLNDLGIYLWSNKSLYGYKCLKPLNPEECQPIQIRMPTVKQSQEDILADTLEDLEMTDGDEEEQDMEEAWSVEQIQNCVTLAGLPPARWQHLHNLDVIKARNKPKEAVQKTKNAPFFLPTVTGPDGQVRFNLEADKSEETEKKKPAILEHNLTNFGQKLWDTDGNDSLLLETLKAMGPSAIDLEIVALSPEGGGSTEVMVKFLNLLQKSFQDHKDFEAGQAYLGLFLKHHSDIILNSEELLQAIEHLKPEMTQSWLELKKSLTFTSTLVSFSKNSLLTTG